MIKNPKVADPICQLAHLCSHSMKDQSKNPQMPLGQQPKLGQLHYPFHPRLKVLLKTASVTSPDKTTIVLPATTVVSPAKYKNSANKWHTSSHNNNTINPTLILHPITHPLPCKAPTIILAKYSLPKSPQQWPKYKTRPLNHQPNQTIGLQQVSQNHPSANLSWMRPSTQPQ